MMRTIIKSCALLSALVSGFSFAEAVPLTPYTFTGYQGEKVAAQIGEFKVPAVRSKQSEKMLTLKFVKFPTTSKNPANPIVYLSGGPGGSATGTAKRARFALFKKLTAHADVILFDQRGTGLSNETERCSVSNTSLEAPTNWQSVLKQQKENIKHCVKQWQSQGVDLNSYNTKENAADLVALTNALGADKINLWGISYGSHLAFATMKYHPNIVDKVALASLEGLDETIKLPARVHDLVKKISDELKSRPDTAVKYPNLIKEIQTQIEALNNQPAIVKTQLTRSKEIVTVGVSGLDLQFALSYVFLRDPSNLKSLPRIIYDMRAGRYEEIAAYIAFIKQYSNGYSAMGVAMDAASGISKSRWKAVKKQGDKSIVGRTTNFPYPDINHLVPVSDLGEQFRTEITSDIPSLFIAGTYDGRTLYSSQKALAQNFSNSSFITVKGGGHNVYMSHPSIGEAVADFFAGKHVPSKTITLDSLQFE